MVIYSSRGLPLAQMLWNQIGRRIKISGAQWNRHNVAQVLKHRCAYLNGYVYSPKYIYSAPIWDAPQITNALKKDEVQIFQ